MTLAEVTGTSASSVHHHVLCYNISTIIIMGDVFLWIKTVVFGAFNVHGLTGPETAVQIYG